MHLAFSEGDSLLQVFPLCQRKWKSEYILSIIGLKMRVSLPCGRSHDEGRHALPIGLVQGPPQLGIWCPVPKKILALRGS